MSKRYPMPIPHGWYAVAYSDELAVGESRPERYFGKDLVLFRTESGRASLLDAYCPHLGAHLGYGIHENTGRGGGIVVAGQHQRTGVRPHPGAARGQHPATQRYRSLS